MEDAGTSRPIGMPRQVKERRSLVEKCRTLGRTVER